MVVSTGALVFVQRYHEFGPLRCSLSLARLSVHVGVADDDHSLGQNHDHGMSRP